MDETKLNEQDYKEIDLYIDTYLREHNAHRIRIITDIFRFENEKHETLMTIPVQVAKCIPCNKIIGFNVVTELQVKILQNHGHMEKKSTQPIFREPANKPGELGES